MVIPDDDLLNCITAKGKGYSEAIGEIIHKIMSEHNKYIDIQKDYLPSKCKPHLYPQIYWIQPPLHVNFANNAVRPKFGKALENVVKHNENTHVLQLLKGWDSDDTNLYVYHNRRFTTSGFTSYWNAVDKTARYIDTIHMKKLQKPKHSDRYHWQQPQNQPERRKLPSPPK